MVCLFQYANAQYATTKVSSRQQAYVDSLKKVDYDYIFPFLGQETYRAGFDIPYPVGLMGNFMWMNSSILVKIPISPIL